MITVHDETLVLLFLLISSSVLIFKPINSIILEFLRLLKSCLHLLKQILSHIGLGSYLGQTKFLPFQRTSINLQCDKFLSFYVDFFKIAFCFLFFQEMHASVGV